jgi:protein tyrosine phosphatase (PTP) superfamily phosphohydrolase (DUF442 family)
MLHRAIPVVCWILGGGILGAMSAVPLATADGSPDQPAAPKNIDETPPLVPIPNARVTKTGLLIGGQPTPEHLKAIHEAGYRMIVTLRTDGEPGDEGEQAAVERLGLKYVSIPVDGAEGLTEDNARALDKELSGVDVLPAVVHCSTGQRVSALLGLKAFVVDRMSAAAAIDLAKSLGMKKFEAALRERIAEICKSDKSRNCKDVQ